MPQICIIALIGLPGAGKTTFSRQQLCVEQEAIGIIHFCFDDLMQLNYNQNCAESIQFKRERLKVMALLQSTVVAIKEQKPLPHGVENNSKFHGTHFADYLILCDDNNYYASMRYQLFRLCQSQNLRYGQIFFPITLDQALNRNVGRDTRSQLPVHIIEQMFKRLEAPNAEKNKWESVTLTVEDSYNLAASEEFNQFIANVLANDIKQHSVPVKVEHIAVAASAMHQQDLLLRREINSILKMEMDLDQKRDLAQKLNKQRKEILQNCKNSPTTMNSVGINHFTDIHQSMCKQ